MWICTFCLAASMLMGADEKEVPRWAQPSQCGANCLHAFLKLLDHPVDYDSLSEEVSVDPVQGVSLQALADVAMAHGESVEIRKVTAADLGKLPLPFVLHLELADVGGSGHFITVYMLSPEPDSDCFFIDGGNGLAIQQNTSQLTPMMTGYALVPRARGVLDVQRSSYASLVLRFGLLSLPLAVFVGWLMYRSNPQ